MKLKKCKFYEEDVLNVVRNMFVVMESETDDIKRYLKKVNAPKGIDEDVIFTILENAIEICEEYNKKH